jgi:hypothetical protein
MTTQDRAVPAVRLVDRAVGIQSDRAHGAGSDGPVI